MFRDMEYVPISIGERWSLNLKALGGTMMKSRTGWTLLWVGLVAIYANSLSAQEQWVYRYDGPASGADGAYSIAVGPDDSLYVAGQSTVSGTTGDFTVISLTTSGQERWVYGYNGPANDADCAYSIVVGADSNLYAAGSSQGSGTGLDFAVISLTASGAERWVYRYNGTGNGNDWASSIVMGTDGNLYAAGVSEGSGTSEDFIVVSLTPSGSERWVYRHNGAGNGSDGAHSIVAGPDTNVYAAGYSGGSGTSEDFAVIGLTVSGQERWVYSYNGPANDVDCAYSIMVGTDDNLYCAGVTTEVGQWGDFAVVSLDTSGTERWVYSYNGAVNLHDYANSIVMGTDGNLYAAGASVEIGTGVDFTVLSLTASGGERWVYSYNGPANDRDEASSVVMGMDGNLYAAGKSYGSGTVYDFTVISLTPSGGRRWVYWYNGSGNLSDEARSVAAGMDGNIYAAGYSRGSGTMDDFTVIGLSPVGVEEEVINDQSTMTNDQLVQCYPNPFGAGGTTISFNVKRSTLNVSLRVYDLSGQLIRSLIHNERLSSFQFSSRGGFASGEPISVVWDGKDGLGREVGSGVYICRLVVGDYAAARKLVVLR